MASQLAIDWRTDLDRKFDRWAEHNSHIVDAIEHAALELRRQGWRRYGIKTLFEWVRYHTDLREGPGSSYRLNNNYSSRTARLLMQRNLELRGFFNVRELRS